MKICLTPQLGLISHGFLLKKSYLWNLISLPSSIFSKSLLAIFLFIYLFASLSSSQERTLRNGKTLCLQCFRLWGECWIMPGMSWALNNVYCYSSLFFSSYPWPWNHVFLLYKTLVSKRGAETEPSPHPARRRKCSQNVLIADKVCY